MTSLFRSVRSENTDTSTVWSTPWEWREADGMYVGRNGEVWLYRSFPIMPIAPEWEDLRPRLSAGRQLETTLIELGETSKDSPLVALKGIEDYREIHVISISWQSQARPPEANSDKLTAYQEEVFDFTVPNKTLLLGVRLRSSLLKKDQSLLNAVKSRIVDAMGETVPDLERYERDRMLVEGILSRGGFRKPSGEERRQLESWYNLGRGPSVPVYEHDSYISVDDLDRIELAGVSSFNQTVQYAAHSQWLADAETAEGGARLVSVRAQLEPAAAARRRARSSQRKIKAQIDEELATGDLERPEFSDTFQLAQKVEDHFVSSNEPLLANCSIIMARRVEESDETYIDFLKSTYQIEVEPLRHRQLPALDETLPCSSKRVNPFRHDLTVSMIAYAGMNGFSAIGDRKGAYIGLAHPNYTTVFLDPLGAPAANKPPSCFIFGDPGSGKTFLSQILAYQASLDGLPVMFINPKGFDTLAPLADLAGGRVISMSRMERAAGAFDPFRYSPDPYIAAEILTSHILSVLTEFTEAQELALSSGVTQGALAGAKCAKDAVMHVKDPTVVKMIRQQVESSSQFSLGFGLTPMDSMRDDRRLTLIEFDRKLDLPDPGAPAGTYTRSQRIALAAIRLVTRASIEILAGMGGGMIVLDEAWTFLSHNTGRSALQQIGREGRSLNLLPVFATQRVADLLGGDMEGYMSRVFVMALRDEREAAAALTLCGLEPTRGRLEWLAKAGPRPKTSDEPGRPAMALHRDLQDRHSAVLVGPTPDYVYQKLTTNPEERKALLRKLSADPS